jgi:SAM-dependent methyltransferase
VTTLTIDNPAYFRQLADIEQRHWWSLGMWRLASEWLNEALAGRRDLLAMDVGCGTGETARRLAGLPMIGRVIGLDPSPDALALARLRHDHPLLHGTATALPLSSRSVDLATCFDVLQHLEPGGDARALAEIARVLVPGGLALIRANGQGLSHAPLAYRLDDLVARCEAAGLRIRRASHANCLPSLAQEVRGRLRAPSSLLRTLAHPEGGGLRIRLPSPWLNTLMLGVTRAEAILAGRLGMRLPFGHSTMILAERPQAGVEADKIDGL